MEIKGIKSLKGRYILQKTRSIEKDENKYKITEKDLTDFAKMQSAEGIKKAIDGLGKFLEEPELEMQR